MKLISTKGRGAKAAKERVATLVARRSDAYLRAVPTARKIVESVRKGGDAALRRYGQKFDGITSQTPLQISTEEMETAWNAASPSLKQALKQAEKNVRAFATKQRPRDFSFSPVPGLTVGQQVRPLGAVGCYVPSGRYPLPSTLLMTVVPAQVAGVPRIVVISPKPAPETLAAAHMLGVTEFYRTGGAQGVAALAYGTATIARVDKIVGPGNAYVTAAKSLVAFDCSIDMLAGPTEIVVTSETGNVEAISSDLIAQAEHDPDAFAVFVTTNEALAKSVVADVKLRARSNKIAAQAIRNNGFAIVTESVEEAREITNALAPEHLTVDTDADLAWVQNAGSIFIGNESAQPLGDYISGPNHTLPTGGVARVRGGLSVMDFLKLITVQQYDAQGLKRLAPLAIEMAEAEGLTGHAEAIRVRSRSL